MAAPLTLPPLADDSVSAVRLHGEACWHCGSVAGLRTVGEVSTRVGGGVLRVWPIVACPVHVGRSTP